MDRKLRLTVLLPEEARVRKARGEHLAIAVDNAQPAIGRVDIGRAHEGIGQFAVLLAHEVLLVDPRGKLDGFGRNFEEILIETAQQRHRPFGQPGIFDHQTFVLDQRVACRCSRFCRLAADQVLTLGMIDQHESSAQALDVSIRAGNRDFTGRMEAVTFGDRARGNALDLAFDQFAAQDGHDARKRAHPAQAFRAERGGAPAL